MGVARDLHRSYLGLAAKAEKRYNLQYPEYKCDFFLELNAKHIHGGKNEGITIC